MTADELTQMQTIITDTIGANTKAAKEEITTAIERHQNSDHHRFVDEMIEERQRRTKRIEQIKAQVFGWGIIGFLGSVGTAVYQFFIKNGGS